MAKKSKNEESDAGPALTAELTEIVRLALAALKTVKRQLYTLGTLYATVEREGLAKKAGFTNADDFWLKHIPTDAASLPVVQLWSRISFYSSDICNTYRVTCLDMLIRGFKRKGWKLANEDPGDLTIEFNDEDGHHQAKKFRDCSVHDMELFFRRRGEPKQGALSAEEKHYMADIQRMIRFAANGDTTIKVTGEHDEEDELMLDIRIPRFWFGNMILSLEAWAIDGTKGRRPPSAPFEPTAQAPRRKVRRG